MRAPGLITAVEGCAQPSDTGGTLDRCELHYAALEIETKCRFIGSSTLDAITKTQELIFNEAAENPGEGNDGFRKSCCGTWGPRHADMKRMLSHSRRNSPQIGNRDGSGGGWRAAGGPA